jgi:hypothetical protein
LEGSGPVECHHDPLTLHLYTFTCGIIWKSSQGVCCESMLYWAPWRVNCQCMQWDNTTNNPLPFNWTGTKITFLWFHCVNDIPSIFSNSCIKL